MPYNVDIIKNNWSLIYEAAVEAEKNVYSAPRTSLFYSRLALDRAINWLYANDDYLKKLERDDLYNLMYEQTFRENLSPSLFSNDSAVIKEVALLKLLYYRYFYLKSEIENQRINNVIADIVVDKGIIKKREKSLYIKHVLNKKDPSKNKTESKDII
jgi:hypothetical protein